MSAKVSALMKTAQLEKTRQTVQKLVEWYAVKEQFYKTYLTIQQSIIKKTVQAAEITMTRLRDIAIIMKEEKEMQAVIFDKC